MSNSSTDNAVPTATPWHPGVQLFFPVLFLVGIGIVMVYSASSAVALKRFGSDIYFLKKHAVYALVGIVILVLFKHVPYKLFKPLAYPLLVLSLFGLILVQLTSFGLSAGGSTRWLRFGGFSFQPSEIARFAFIIYLAYSLSKKGEKLKDIYIGLLPHLLMMLLFTSLILLQPDFGSAVLLAAITWLMLFIGGVPILHLASVLAVNVPIAYLVMINADYRLERLTSFLHPWEYSANEGYQIVHSLMAFGTGGIFGTGLGQGYQKLFYLPEPHTDFIFSVIGEELGLFGVFFILALYLIILWKGVSIAKNCPDTFGSFLAAGITTAITIQVCVNMCVTLGLLPTKGLPLPFLSYGGTSLLINMASIGILMNIASSKNLKKAA